MKKKVYYKLVYTVKRETHNWKVSGVFLFVSGISIMFFFAFPVIFWKLVKEPMFASVITPLSESIETETSFSPIQEVAAVSTRKKTNVKTWFLGYEFREQSSSPTIASYLLSIPKIGVVDAKVSTVDSDLEQHLVQYWGTPIPPLNGNTIIFGHSTLPQLYNPNDYKTIFAHIEKVELKDEIQIVIGNIQYTYLVSDIFITTPDDLSVLSQDVNGSQLTIVTCTPPGTVWKRLIIKAKLK